jgi:hypothetical protein
MDIAGYATSQLYWVAALVAALIDIAFVALLVWRIKPAFFRQLKWKFVIVAGLFWLGLWSWVMWDPFFWETCYQYIFPAWIRPLWPPLYGLVACAVALFFWWLSLRIPIHPVLSLILLGGLESFPGHIRAIYWMGLLETPLLKNVSPASALTFGFFEFAFYWCIILIIASLIHWISGRIPGKRKRENI